MVRCTWVEKLQLNVCFSMYKNNAHRLQCYYFKIKILNEAGILINARTVKQLQVKIGSGKSKKRKFYSKVTN